MDRLRHKRFGALLGAALLAAGFSSVSLAGVSIVDDGAAGGPAKIQVRSAIHRGDAGALEAAFDRVALTAKGRINGAPFVTVELDSPGGDVVEALEMGRAINRHLAMTLVRPGHECVSACVFVLMAGAVHTPINGAEIGVHRPLLVSWAHMDAHEAHARFDALMVYLRGYFRELGISDDAYRTMMGTDSFGMHDFTPGELDTYGLRGEGPAWRQYFADKQSVAGVGSGATPTQAATQATRLPPVPETFRTVVFMPGDFGAKDWFAGTDIKPTHLIWDSLDDEYMGPDWAAPDIAALLPLIAQAAHAALQPIWWLVLALLVELVRGSYLPWPGLDPDSRRLERWRLRAFR